MNKNYIKIILMVISCLLLTEGICAQEKGSCEWLVKKYFLDPKFSEVKDYIAKEEFGYQTSHPSIGEIFKEPLDSGFIEISYRNIYEDSNRSVYAVTFTSEKMATDMYCHMHNKEGKWKIHSVRELALTGFLFAVIDTIETLTEIPDSLQYLYDNCKLTVSSDENLKNHFKKNDELFKETIELFNSDSSYSRFALDNDGKFESTKTNEIEKTIYNNLRKLHLQSVYRSDEFIFFTIGGMVDNIASYLFVPSGVKPPQIDPDEYIYIEKIIENWYIIKET